MGYGINIHTGQVVKVPIGDGILFFNVQGGTSISNFSSWDLEQSTIINQYDAYKGEIKDFGTEKDSQLDGVYWFSEIIKGNIELELKHRDDYGYSRFAIPTKQVIEDLMRLEATADYGSYFRENIEDLIKDYNKGYLWAFFEAT